MCSAGKTGQLEYQPEIIVDGLRGAPLWSAALPAIKNTVALVQGHRELL
jgi:hypothetical protein